MSLTIKTYVAMFVLMLSVFSLAGIMSVTIDIGNAREFHAAVISEIETSNFAPSVIEACENQAVASGYELMIDEESIVRDAEGRATLMEVILRYKYTINLFNVAGSQQIRGFAR